MIVRDATCYLDLDGFKPINDLYGHHVGDLLLIEIAHRLEKNLRINDTIARLGGDEFVILMTNLERPEDCVERLQEILSSISNPIDMDGSMISISGSLGVTVFPDDDSDADTLLRHADQAMYHAKEKGKNGYRIYDAVQGRAFKARRSELERLRSALIQRELIFFYQPKVDIVDGTVCGFEALVRWQHPDRGIIPPGDFLPVLQGSELEWQLGEYAIETALAQIDDWSQLGIKTTISVNIAASHLLRIDFISRLAFFLSQRPAVEPSSLEIEILESAALSDIDAATGVLSRCRALGVKVALDDFGTGYSSLAYFRRLPVDTLKIDCSFVVDMLVDANDLDIVDGIVKLSTAYARKVIAEGVESEEHAAALLTLGCRVCQGYGIGRPMPCEAVKDWLLTWNSRQLWRSLSSRLLHREVLPLIVAARNHVLWINHLRSHFDSSEMTRNELELLGARFNMWYESSGGSRYGALPGFAKIRPLHELVRIQVCKVVERLDVGDRQGAELAFESLDKYQAAVLVEIENLIEIVSTPVQPSKRINSNVE